MTPRLSRFPLALEGEVAIKSTIVSPVLLELRGFQSIQLQHPLAFFLGERLRWKGIMRGAAPIMVIEQWTKR
jgi:hypothetical protein